MIRNGVPGSGMPRWPLLTPAEIQAVTVYIRSFYHQSDAACRAESLASTSGKISKNGFGEEDVP